MAEAVEHDSEHDDDDRRPSRRDEARRRTVWCARAAVLVTALVVLVVLLLVPLAATSLMSQLQMASVTPTYDVLTGAAPRSGGVSVRPALVSQVRAWRWLEWVPRP